MKLILYTSTKYKIVKIEPSDDGKSALLLGYRLRLTVTEHKLLSLLCAEKAPIHKNDIAKKSGAASSSIAVHIASINKKAYPITKRRLIIGERNGEYRINEYM